MKYPGSQPDVAASDDQHERQQYTQERVYIPRLPRPAESPMLSDSEREAAEGAESQEETDDIGEPPQHLQ
jgi:hypothetical protein